jgi:hypothetical protein
MCMGLVNRYQKNTFSLAPISAQSAMWTIYHSCISFLGYSEQCERSSHCVSQPGASFNSFLLLILEDNSRLAFCCAGINFACWLSSYDVAAL